MKSLRKYIGVILFIMFISICISCVFAVELVENNSKDKNFESDLNIENIIDVDDKNNQEKNIDDTQEEKENSIDDIKEENKIDEKVEEKKENLVKDEDNISNSIKENTVVTEKNEVKKETEKESNISTNITNEVNTNSTNTASNISNPSTNTTENVEILTTTTNPGITYKTHVQNVGWQDWKSNGKTAGTSGKGYRLEGIYIKLENARDIKLRYRTHIQDVGWQDWKSNGQLSGTSGQSKRLEGIKIELQNSSEYSVKYRVHIQNIGWQEWKYDGEFAGTEGLGLRLEAIEIQIVDKLDKEKRSTNTIKHIFYSTHVQDVGWQDYKLDGDTAGTTGRSKRLEAIKISGYNLPKGVSLKYQTHIQDIGWQGWKGNNILSGTEGKSKRLEAIRIKLEGSSEYSVRYRVHVQDIGWQDWCYDGETSGTFGLSKRLEGIQIQIVPKASLSKTKIYIDNPNGNISNTQQTVKGWLMTSKKNVSLKVFIDNNEITSIQRVGRQDVTNFEKGYGDESIYNPTPGFTTTVDFSKYSIGKHTIKVQAIENNKVIKEESKNFNVEKTIVAEKGYYGVSGLKAIGDSRGSDLHYYKYGNGSNVLYATFAVHGFEDLWAHDGWELVEIAEYFYQTLLNLDDYTIHDKWTIYIFPGVNQDGLNYGYSNNGPGRTTFTSTIGRSIDLNRCWQTGSSFSVYNNDRYYSGTAPCQAYEAMYLRDFLLNHKSVSGQTVLVDLHGWLQQMIGDDTVCSYYSSQFPENKTTTVGRYGDGYLIGWARLALGNSNRPAKSALIELPYGGIYNHQTVVNHNFAARYTQATLSMLRGMN